MDSICIRADEYNHFPAEKLGVLLSKQPTIQLKSASVGSDNWVEKQLREQCKKTSNNDFCKKYLDAAEVSQKYSDAYSSDSGTLQAFMKLTSFDPLSISPMILAVDAHFVNERHAGNPLASISIANGDGSHLQSNLYLAANASNEIHNLMEYSESIPAISVPQNYATAIGYLIENRSSLDAAVSILSASHPEIHPDNLLLMVATHFVHEFMAIDYLDIWQDLSACESVDCEMRDKIAAAFPELHSAPAGMLWSFATFFSRNKRNQGYGPGQTILGLALESASYGPIADRYGAVLSESELKTEEGALKALLDPKKAIYYRALIYDYLLTRLKTSVFYSPQVRAPSDQYPFPADDNAARQMALIDAVQHLSVYPEDYHNIATSFSHGLSSLYWAEYYLVGEVLNVKPHLSGLQMVKEKYLDVDCINLGQGDPSPQLLDRMFPIEIRFIIPKDSCSK